VAKFPRKVVSGGQTGVDRAALDFAAEAGIEHGGWCPRGRRAEDGTIPKKYRLTETDSDRYEDRTRFNVRDSDGTLVLTVGQPSGGTRLTVQIATELAKPLLVIDLDDETGAVALNDWLSENAIETLNVAGPRESGLPGIRDRALAYLRRYLRANGEVPCR